MGGGTGQIRMICGGCRKLIAAPAGSAGMQVACPLCGARLRVPGGASATAASSARPQQDGFADFFNEALAEPTPAPKPKKPDDSPFAAGAETTRPAAPQTRYLDNVRPKFDAFDSAAEARKERAREDVFAGLICLVLAGMMLFAGAFLGVFFCFAPVLVVMGLFKLFRGLMAAVGVE